MMISEPHPVSYPVDVSGVHPTVLRRVPIDHATSGTILQRANRCGGLYGFAQTLRVNALQKTLKFQAVDGNLIIMIRGHGGHLKGLVS